MPTIAVHNLDGKETTSLNLNEAVFGVTPKTSVIHQVYVALMANLRAPWADTKNKGEVRGGGKKPWKQKGTGRARHGSIRSPIWKGGGVTFGPLSVRNYKQKINRKMNRLALAMVLSGKVLDKSLFAVADYPTSLKTKDLNLFLSKFPVAHKTVLLVTTEKDTAAQGVKNLPKVDVVRGIDLNVKDILHHRFVFVTPSVIEVLEKRCLTI